MSFSGETTSSLEVGEVEVGAEESERVGEAAVSVGTGVVGATTGGAGRVVAVVATVEVVDTEAEVTVGAVGDGVADGEVPSGGG